MANIKLPESELPKKQLREKYQRLYELVVEQLTDWILDGTLKAGQRINPEEICRQLGVSRMPVRDALKILEENGLVDVVPYMGTTVASLSLDEVYELYEMRMALEPLASYYALKKISDEEIEELEAIKEALEELAMDNKEPRDEKQIYKLNRMFHQTLYSFSQMKTLCKTIDGVLSRMSYLRLKSVYKSKEYIESMLEEHELYMECIRSRDAEKMRNLQYENLKKHYEKLEKDYIEHKEGEQG